MSTKLIYLTSFVLVVGLVLTDAANAVDPNLVGWWKFDEGSGTTAFDSSGNENHGTLNGPVKWVAEGHDGACLNFTGPYNFVLVENSPELNPTTAITICAWINPKWTGNNRILQKSEGTGDNQYRLLKEWGDNMVFHLPGLSPDRLQFPGVPPAGEWTHLAAVYDGSKMIVYYNGKVAGEQASTGRMAISTGSLRIGTKHATAPAGDEYNGMMDDVRIYNRALSPAEIKAFVPPKLKAYNPNPADRATNVTAPLLQWSAGDTAASHDVYFGTNPTPGAAEFIGRQTFNIYWHMPGLTPGTTYYWRIDEVEADGVTIHKGDVWSFTSVVYTAYNPRPDNGAIWVDLDADLSWTAGFTMVKHDVYFGTNQADVAAGTGGTFKASQTATTYDPGALAQNTTYYWRVDEYDSGGKKYPGTVWSFTTMSLGVIGGIKGQYYNNLNLTGMPVLTRIDPEINFTWAASPGPGVNVDDFSVRWTGELIVPFSQTYTFYANVQMAIRLWVNDQLLIDNWMVHHMIIEYQGKIDLKAGKCPIVMEVADWQWTAGEAAVAQLSWQSPSIAKQIIPQSALTPPLRASGPSPADGAVDVTQTPTLRWSPGDKAAQHDVYLGTDAAAVADATTASTGIYRGRQNRPANSYVPTEAPLAWNTTYYWRIDEVNGVDVWKGSLWSFTTANFIVVDDFEDYTDDVGSRIFQTWKDGLGFSLPAPGYPGNGTGSAVGNSVPPYAEQTVIHGGAQSMPLTYDNSGTGGKARYSETFREWTTPQDWTVNNVKALTLYFRGNPPDFLESPPGTYTMSAEGSDIWGGTDEFRYMYKQLSGDGEIIAKVVSIGGPGTNEWRKAGVMIRETLDPASKHAFMAITPNPAHGLAFQFRHEAGDSDSEHGVDIQTAPYWVKVVRKGNVFTGYHSPDGVTWTMKDPSGAETDASNPVTIPMAANVYIGLALTSHENDVLCVAQFSNVSTAGSVTGAWTVADIASTVTGTNTAEPLYVAVEDNTGKVKVVNNADPGAAVQTDWQEWNIDLKDFSGAGVNLKAVKKMYIGLGNRASPKAGGTGKIYIDDIRVYPSRCIPSMGKPAADLSGNCVVDYADLDILANEWLDKGAAVVADLDGDDDVDAKDFAVLADAWLEQLLWP